MKPSLKEQIFVSLPVPANLRDPAEQTYVRTRVAHWDAIAREPKRTRRMGAYYHRRLAEIYRHLVAPGLHVLELGCGQGDLLASLHPERGVGIDFSAEMVERAAARHPGLVFLKQDASTFELDEKFDVVIL